MLFFPKLLEPFQEKRAPKMDRPVLMDIGALQGWHKGSWKGKGKTVPAKEESRVGKELTK